MQLTYHANGTINLIVAIKNHAGITAMSQHAQTQVCILTWIVLGTAIVMSLVAGIIKTNRFA